MKLSCQVHRRESCEILVTIFVFHVRTNYKHMPREMSASRPSFGEFNSGRVRGPRGSVLPRPRFGGPESTQNFASGHRLWKTMWLQIQIIVQCEAHFYLKYNFIFGWWFCKLIFWLVVDMFVVTLESWNLICWDMCVVPYFKSPCV
jgi:hypothetical protein